MATISQAYSQNYPQAIDDARAEPELSYVLTGRRIAITVPLAALAWAMVLGPLFVLWR